MYFINKTIFIRTPTIWLGWKIFVNGKRLWYCKHTVAGTCLLFIFCTHTRALTTGRCTSQKARSWLSSTFRSSLSLFLSTLLHTQHTQSTCTSLQNNTIRRHTHKIHNQLQHNISWSIITHQTKPGLRSHAEKGEDNFFCMCMYFVPFSSQVSQWNLGYSPQGEHNSNRSRAYPGP
jgi:hypothetical protein